MTATVTTSATPTLNLDDVLVPRYTFESKPVLPGDDDTDWQTTVTDRLTGHSRVETFDPTDPPNYDAEKGADRVRYGDCAIRDLDESVLRSYHEFAEAWKASRDLLTVLGSDVAEPDFSGTGYRAWEQKVAKPALEALGYTRVNFNSSESDSFGPLTRACFARKDGVLHVFTYG